MKRFRLHRGTAPMETKTIHLCHKNRLIPATVDGILDARVVSYHIGTYRAQPAMEKINKTAHANIKGFQKVAAVKI